MTYAKKYWHQSAKEKMRSLWHCCDFRGKRHLYRQKTVPERENNGPSVTRLVLLCPLLLRRNNDEPNSRFFSKHSQSRNTSTYPKEHTFIIAEMNPIICPLYVEMVNTFITITMLILHAFDRGFIYCWNSCSLERRGTPQIESDRRWFWRCLKWLEKEKNDASKEWLLLGRAKITCLKRPQLKVFSRLRSTFPIVYYSRSPWDPINCHFMSAN